MEITIPLREALFWMNTYRELLGVEERALVRIRALAAAHPGPPEDYVADLQLIWFEVERVKDRLRYWENVVDSRNGSLRAG
jgi:hypothetical protein